MSKKTIRESLLELDRKFLGTDKYKDLTTLYESQEISGNDKSTLKKLINDIKDKEELQNAIISVLQEDVDGDFDYDETPEWEMVDKKSVLDYDGFWTDYSLWHNLITDEWVCIFGDIDLYNPVTTYSDVEFETEDEAREWFEDYNGFVFDDNDLNESLEKEIEPGDLVYLPKKDEYYYIKYIKPNVYSLIKQDGKCEFNFVDKNSPLWNQLVLKNKKANPDFVLKEGYFRKGSIPLEDDITLQLFNLFAAEGYDTNSPEVDDYISSMAPIIEDDIKHFRKDDDYNVRVWYEETKRDYPEELAKLPKSNLQEEVNFENNQMIIEIISGISGDRFNISIISNNEIIFKKEYAYGYNASYSKAFKNPKAPYINDIITDLCDQYNVSRQNIQVIPGRNVFRDTKVSNDVINDFIKNHLPLDEDFKTDGWQDVYKPYSGADRNFQSLIQNNKRIGYIEEYYDDGDWGYCAYLNISNKNHPIELEDYEFLGNFKSREEAQKAIENKSGLKEWYAGEPADDISYHPTKGNISNIFNLKIGDKIYHSSYGEGIIDDIKDDKVYVMFDNNQKRIFQGKGITYLNKIEKTLSESDTLNDDEFDYFAVYEGDILQGEYPTYFDAKENCKGSSCTIKGVKQYGPHAYEETPLNEDYDDILTYVDYACDKIKKELPNNLYIDDIKWGETRMEIPIFRHDFKNPFNDKEVYVFDFKFYADEDLYGSKQEQIDEAIADFIERIK